MSYSIFFYFRIYFLFLYLFELFENSKYTVIYKIGDLWNINSFQFVKFFKFSIFWSWKILEIW